MAVRRVPDENSIPRIPVSRVETIVNEREAVLFWVHCGTATFVVAGAVHTLPAGRAIWVPAGISHRVLVAEDSVAFRVFAAASMVPASLDQVFEVAIPAEWSDWLVFQFALELGFLRAAKRDNAELLKFVAGSGLGRVPSGKNAASVAAPALPRSRAARSVARVLVGDPADATTLTEHATRRRVGVRTLQQRFVQETGLSFVRWRAAFRVAVAAEHLDRGDSVGWAARRVGFRTAAGFTRAFRNRAGCSPLEYTRSRPARAGRRAPASLADEIQVLVSQDPGTASPPASVPAIPPTRTWHRVNDFDVVVWVYRGKARVTTGDRTRLLRRGDAIVLPAGVYNHIDLEAGSIVLPLGEPRLPVGGGKRGPRLLHFPLAAENWLLHSVVATFSDIKPTGFDPRLVADLVRAASESGAHAAASQDRHDPVQHVIRKVSADLADSRSLNDWARTTGADPLALRDGFRRATGQSFTRWRADQRMTMARSFLESGVSVGESGRRLGYAHPSGFTQVFTKAHGMTPRAYQRRYEVLPDVRA